MRVPPKSIVVLLALPCVLHVRDSSATPQKSANFAVARIHLERNQTDGDAEAVIEVVAGDCGLRVLTVTGPDGRVVANFRAPAEATLGLRELILESPEPAIATLLAAYPEGVYRFAGESACGEVMTSAARLAHSWPEPSRLLSPAFGKPLESIAETAIEWARVTGAKGYVVEIEQRRTGVKLQFDLPADVTHIFLPPGLLKQGHPLDVGVGSVGQEGNTTFIEFRFSTSSSTH